MPFKRHKQYRLPGYDYSCAGAYFITICTAGRRPLFGHIRDGVMHYSPTGQLVADNLEGLEGKLPHLQIDEWEVMSDHVHLVITLHPGKVADTLPGRADWLSERSVVVPERAAARRVPTDADRMHDASGLRSLRPKSVESFINHFKGRVTRWCDTYGHSEFAWQARFYDRIIRNFEEYCAIMAYVQNNIAAWEDLYNDDDLPGAPSS